MAPSVVLVRMVLFTFRRVFAGSKPSTTRNLGYAFLLVDTEVVSESAVQSVCFRFPSWHQEYRLGWRVSIGSTIDCVLTCSCLTVCTPRLGFKSLWLETNFAKNAWTMTSTKCHPSTHGYSTLKGQPLPVTHSPPSHALYTYFNSPQGPSSPPPLVWDCPV